MLKNNYYYRLINSNVYNDLRDFSLPFHWCFEMNAKINCNVILCNILLEDKWKLLICWSFRSYGMISLLGGVYTSVILNTVF